MQCEIVMIEGEEEIGSDNLEPIFVAANKDRLKADVILISDTAIIANDTYLLMVLRGLSYLRLEVTGPNRDLHQVCMEVHSNKLKSVMLSKMIASLRDENNHITINILR